MRKQSRAQQGPKKEQKKRVMDTEEVKNSSSSGDSENFTEMSYAITTTIIVITLTGTDGILLWWPLL